LKKLRASVGAIGGSPIRICPGSDINGTLALIPLTVAIGHPFDLSGNFGVGGAIMREEKKGLDRVTFGRGHDVCIMAIDGTWRRDCLLQAISDTDAQLTVEGSIQGLNLKEFFLLLSSTGLAYRRCERVRVNGTDMDIEFLKTKGRKKKAVDYAH
jgi:hypothetical protein